MDIPSVLTSSFSRVGQKTIFIGLIALVVIIIGYTLRSTYLVEVPQIGGIYTESIVGPPRFVNPVLAFSQTDKDLTKLIYSSLVQSDGQGGLRNTLAQSITVSEDGKEYIVTLRDDIFFHDGEHITSDDVVFTIESIQDAIIQSPLRPQWQGVTVEKIDSLQVQFTLDQAYPLFTTLLDVGIVPEHIWSEISPEELPFNSRNIQPIGSGPYKVTAVQRNEREEITQYSLEAFRGSLFNPFIETIRIRIVKSEQDHVSLLNSGRVDGAVGIQRNLISEDILKGVTIRNYPLPRVFALFYKQQEGTSLASKEVRQAIDMIIDKNAIVDEIFLGYGNVLDGPLPLTSPYASYSINEIEEFNKDTAIENARALLSRNSWKFSEEANVWTKTISNQTATTSFTLITPESDELVKSAEKIRSDLAEIGINITISTRDTNELIQDVIRPRDYEILLFGYVTDIPADIYSFFHSSGRMDPGLNFAEYVNIGVDKSLETIRSTSDTEEIAKAYASINEGLDNDVPATFLFTQDLLYIQHDSVRQISSLSLIEYPEDRFNNVEEWFVKTERVLPLFRQ